MDYNIETEDLVNVHHTNKLLLVLYSIIISSKLQPTAACAMYAFRYKVSAKHSAT